ncbi:MAG: 4Fe-4S binding protein [Anaerolineales bacterium]|nr:4Fe-4S binding protein [Anaerolineales bacterium]
MSITVVKSRCPQNHYCPAVRYCPVEAIHQDGVAAPRVDAEACIDCNKCVRICPTGALRPA